MNVLFIFDDSIDIYRMGDLKISPGDKVYLFSLTSKAAVNEGVTKICLEAGCRTESVDTANNINLSADKLRDRYIKFIAELPDKVRWHGKNLKEAFAIDKYATLWWFSLIAEKNTYKTDSFFRLVQMEAIVETIKAGQIGSILYGVDSKKLHRALSAYAAKNNIRYGFLVIMADKGWKSVVKNFEKALYLKHIAILAYFATQTFLRTFKIKHRLARLKRKKYDNSITVVTYYPNIDVASAKKGVFKNRFWAGLQESLEREGPNITWIAMYVQNNSVSFEDSIGYAEDFIKRGQAIFFMEEFNSILIQLKALWRSILKSFRFLNMEGVIRDAHIFDEYNFYELFRDDWYASFAGSTGYAGMMYYMIFSSILSKIDSQKCLYPCEMHAWEKALLFAREAVKRDERMYSYQSGTISRMLLNYFNHPSEVSDKGPYPIPRPDGVICNGDVPFRYMVESGWPVKDVLVGEAIRYSHLKAPMKNSYPKKRIVLLALSISPEESNAILTLANEALKDLRDVEVWIKPHPFLNIEKVLKIAGLSAENLPFKIKKEPIEALLPDARIMVVGESGVTIEALAFGCEIITVSTPEWINMSPLKYEKSDIIKKVSSAKELRKVVEAIIAKEYEPEAVRSESSRILNDFFYLDSGSDEPSRILELLRI